MIDCAHHTAFKYPSQSGFILALSLVK